MKFEYVRRKNPFVNIFILLGKIVSFYTSRVFSYVIFSIKEKSLVPSNKSLNLGKYLRNSTIGIQVWGEGFKL